ncbi:MAG TPA: NapC/NirT family cytochrome c [Bryobacteraceae bacterium]|jgi:nitrate/TMAO reductase-like tetraheme cytochrome c subunit
MTPQQPNRSLGGWLSPVIHLSSNWISLIGVILVTTATVFWLFLLPITLRGQATNPYMGILAFLLLPGPFFVGLILIPLGMWVKRKRERHSGIYPPSFPRPEWRNPELRKLVYFVLITTGANLVIASQLSYGAVNYMDSVTFCGQTCHTVMQPEYTAYQGSPHSRVACVMCHIGPGASWFVRSKLSGVGQVFAVTFDTYPRPIPVPVHNLRPARETCEQCHWPEKYSADRIDIITHFADDETNTATKDVLLMKIGGGNHGIGIHGTHLGPGVVIRYWHSDEARQVIPLVEYNDNGRKTVYAAAGAKPDGAGLTMRVMDCIDCHNRPTHAFDLPDRALDKAMAAGLVSPTLPFARKKALEILKVNYQSREDAAALIPGAFETFYRQSYPAVWSAQQSEIVASANQVLDIYDRNVFPDMKVTWGTYPQNIGHTDFPGCFRCHDGGHTAQNGQTITQDCNACHNLLAMDEANPKVLTELGITQETATK